MILPDTEEQHGGPKKPWWWNELGTTVVRSTANRSTVELTYSTGVIGKASAHAIIYRVSPELVSVRRKIFAPIKKERHPEQQEVFELEVSFTKLEMRFAFDTSASVSSDFALRHGADVGVEGKFVRCGPYLLLGDPSKNKLFETMSVFIKDFIVREVDHFVETGKAIRC